MQTIKNEAYLKKGIDQPTLSVSQSMIVLFVDETRDGQGLSALKMVVAIRSQDEGYVFYIETNHDPTIFHVANNRVHPLI